MSGLAIEGLDGQLQKAAELKALHKSTLLKLASQRASQRVYPTFDINPQIVKDFLDKAVSHEGGLPPNGVLFESSQENQSSIEDAGELQNAAETTSDRPTSFAQALLSKLSVADESAIVSPAPTRNHHKRAIASISSIRTNSRGSSRGTSPAKPEHSARNGASPSGVPPPRNGETEDLQNGDSPIADHTGPLLSYSRSLTQNDHNSLVVLSSVALLSDDPAICGAAGEANIPTRSICEIRNISAERRKAEKLRNSDRDIVGEVDILTSSSSPQRGTAGVNGGVLALTEEIVITEGKVAEGNELVKNGITPEHKQIASEVDVAKEDDQVVKAGDGDSGKMGAVPGRAISPGPVEDILVGNSSGCFSTLDGAVEGKEDAPPADIAAAKEQVAILATPASTLEQEVPSPQEASPKPTAPHNLPSSAIARPVEDDGSSDDEVVVFNPRSKRLSQTKTSLNPSRIPQVPQTPKVPKQYEAPSNSGPALIDPDAFGRSFARKPSGVALNAGRTLAARSPRPSPRHSPHRSIATPEPADVDFVLKSGSPRGVARGKGKLWVP